MTQSNTSLIELMLVAAIFFILGLVAGGSFSNASILKECQAKGQTTVNKIVVSCSLK